MRVRRTRPGSVAVLLLFASLLFLSLAPLSDAAQIQPKPSIWAGLAGVQTEDRMDYVLSLENRGGTWAVNIRMDALLPSGLTLADAEGSEWHEELADLANGASTQVAFSTRINPAVADGTVLLVSVEIAYRAPGGTEDYTAGASSQVTVGPRGSLTPLVWLVAAAGVALALLGYGWRVRSEGVRIDQLFLLHDSGMLIRHYTNGNGLQKDGDILSGMLVILQEFVRDSFNDPRVSIEEVRFGDRRVLMARGAHSILAAVVSGRRLNALPARLQRAVAEFEQAQGATLASWDGNLAHLDAADAAFRSLLIPRYRAVGPT